MELEAKYTIAGLFVLVVTLMVVVSLLWVSDATGRQDVDRYIVIFAKHSLDGLQKDSQVTMKGIKVGSVEDYSIDGRNIEAVRVILRVNKDIPVKLDTRAVIKRNILTGLAWVDLVGGTQESRVLNSIDDRYPIIREGASQLDQLASSLPEFIDQANETLAHIKLVFSEENAQNLSSTIKNLGEITEKLNSRTKQFDSILVNVDKTLVKVAKASEHFENLASGLDRGITDIRDELHLSLQQFNNESRVAFQSMRSSADLVSQEFVLMSQNVGDASQAIARTMEAFEQPRDILTGPPAQSFGPGE